MDNEQEIQFPTDTNRYKNVLLVFIFNNNKYEFNIIKNIYIIYIYNIYIILK